MYGGLGCLGTPVVRTDAASIWATGRTWWQVPPVAKVTLTGKLKPGVTGKDVIIVLAGLFKNDEVLNHAVEFSGDGVTTLNIGNRLTIANISTEWGALAGIFPIDKVTFEWLERRADFIAKRGLEGVPSDADGKGSHPRMNRTRIETLRQDNFAPDANAVYAQELTLDLSSVQPFVSGPNSVKVMTSVAAITQKQVKINKAYLMSCVNGRVDDIAQAAEVVRGKKVASGTEFYVAAASSEVQAEAEKRGDWKILVDAGAIILPPGCGACIGMGQGLLGEGEVGISATNRNFKGRMGDASAQAYLGSPAVVAASAIAGYITGPDKLVEVQPRGEVKPKQKVATMLGETKILPGFSETLTAEIVFCHQDNLNTDGIYPGKYTYKDDYTPQQQAAVVMENYDPEFGKLVKEGDILAGGFNFGTGSSREQAATALKYRGLKLVLAGSFSETYKRNALNNGYLVIEAPELIRDLKNRYGTDKLTVRTSLQATVNFRHSKVETEG